MRLNVSLEALTRKSLDNRVGVKHTAAPTTAAGVLQSRPDPRVVRQRFVRCEDGVSLTGRKIVVAGEFERPLRVSACRLESELDRRRAACRSGRRPRLRD